MIAPDAIPPTAHFCPQPLPSRNIMVWGDHGAMEAMRIQFEARGWNWATMVLGEKTEALMLGPPSSLTTEALCSLVDDVNRGKFGKLSAGFALIGAPQPEPQEVRPQ